MLRYHRLERPKGPTALQRFIEDRCAFYESRPDPRRALELAVRLYAD